jgi:CheY-like chemotaxis protein
MTTTHDRRTRILVVDDDAMSCRLLSMLLERLGYEVRFARDGESACVVCSVWKPDVVLLDLTMPWMDGVETAKCLRESHESPRIIALTGHDGPEWRKKTREAGFDQHLVKGCGLEELLAAIEMPEPAASA